VHRFGACWVVATLILVGACDFRKAKAQEVVVQQRLPDLDGDGKPEWLDVMRGEGDQWVSRMRASKSGKGHAGLAFELKGEPHVSQQGEHFELLNGEQAWGLRVLLPRQTPRGIPDLILLNRTHARRMSYLERGFLKLESHHLIPGVAAGIVMIGDSRHWLESLKASDLVDGQWILPLVPALGYQLRFDKADRIERITVDSAAFKLGDDLSVGAALAKVEARYPGQRTAEGWESARYGLITAIDAGDRITALSIKRPWFSRQNRVLHKKQP